MEKLVSVMCPESIMWIIFYITQSYSLSSFLDMITNLGATFHFVMTLLIFKTMLLGGIILSWCSHRHLKINSFIFVSTDKENIGFGKKHIFLTNS